MLFAPEMRKMHATPAVRALRARAQEHEHIPVELVAGLRAPTLLLWGASEKLLPREQLDWYRAHLPPDARVDVVPGFGHVPQMERPRELVQRLAAFADQVGLLSTPARAPAGAAV
jgi:pimeloyl-ACP methyl ester carboxylesterase